MKKFLLYPFVLSIIVSLVFLFLFTAGAEAQDKGSISFQTGGMSSIDTQLEVDFSRFFVGIDSPSKISFDVDLPSFVFGVNFRVNLTEEAPFYLGGNVLFTKPIKNFVFVENQGLVRTSSWGYVLDFNVGMELSKFSVERKFVPFVEGGVGLLGVRNSFFVPVNFRNRKFDAGSQTNFTRHLSLGARSYFGEEENYFFGGKWTLYKRAENPIAVLFEVGFTFE